MARHQIIRMRPPGQGLHARKPRADILVFAGDVETEFLGRVVEIGAIRNVGDGRPLA